MKPEPIFTDAELDEMLAPLADAMAKYEQAEAAAMVSAERLARKGEW